MPTLDPAITSHVLDTVNGDNFEVFGQALLAHALSIHFQPTGGMHDGGQDGFVQPVEGKPTHFVQISVRSDVKNKILETLKWLKESGRQVDTLTYLSSRGFNEKDLLQESIERDTGVIIRILDKRWITLQTQRDEHAANLFMDRFSSSFDSANAIANHINEVYTPSERMSILSYMEVHAASEPRETDLLPIAVDSAIYLSLEGTDPDKEIFKSEEQIIDFVEKTFPAVKGKKSIDLPSRIERLRGKIGNQRIRYHRKFDGYCLPYEVRSEFSNHGRKVRESEVAFWDSIKNRLINEGVDDLYLSAALEACKFAIEKTFEKQGLNFLASIKGAMRAEEIKTYDFIFEKLAHIDDQQAFSIISKACQSTIRHAFYSPNGIEAEHCARLFKAFSIEFSLRGDDKVASYFGKMVKSLNLFVGTDVIVRALSEICARPVGRATQNSLKMLSQAGAKLYLTDYVIDEVWHHIHSTDLEFRNFYASWEKQAELWQVQNSDRILIRAYFYGKLEPDYHEIVPTNWDNFLSMFGDSSWFRDPSGKDGFTAYLRRKFNFKYISKHEIEPTIDKGQVGQLVKELGPIKKDPKLAWNDAYLSLYVLSQRKITGDSRGDSIYGYRNWWLTEEFKILDSLKRIGVHDQLTMHPQFLMNLFAASPGLSSISKNFEGLFPTHFGLRITSRVSSATLTKFLESAKEAMESDHARSEALIRMKANQLLGTQFR